VTYIVGFPLREALPNAPAHLLAALYQHTMGLSTPALRGRFEPADVFFNFHSSSSPRLDQNSCRVISLEMTGMKVRNLPLEIKLGDKAEYLALRAALRRYMYKSRIGHHHTINLGVT
jgi:hypothetical protein